MHERNQILKITSPQIKQRQSLQKFSIFLQMLHGHIYQPGDIGLCIDNKVLYVKRNLRCSEAVTWKVVITVNERHN